MPEIIDMTACELRRLYRRNEVSPVEVVEACLERIAARDPEVRAWAHLDGDYALAQARALPAGKAADAALLHGIPIGFKDIVDTAALPTAYGSPIYAGHRPMRDAACVTASLQQGAILLGKTVTTEFAGRYPNKTANPFDPARTPGGSSSGSAAAVGDRQVFLAIGSQTAGSTIRPAAYCGVHALKPSYGAIAFAGMKPLAPRLDTIGLMSRSVTDLALFRTVLLGATPAEPSGCIDRLRIGLCRTPYWSRAGVAVRDAVEAAAGRLADARTEIREINYPAGFGDAEELCWEVIGFETARHLAWEYERRPRSISHWMRASIERGLRTNPERHAENLRRLIAAERSFDDLFATVDVLLAPAAGDEAPLGLSDTGSPVFNLAFHIAGLPAISLPLGTGPGGLPIGLQLIGPRHQDSRLLGIAAALEPRLI